MRKYFTICLVLACSLAATLAIPVQKGNAQPQRFRFEHLTAADGLPEMSVTAIVQDHLGFLWFATQRGLVKYDGHAMNLYLPAPENSFRGNQIGTLYEDRAGNLWVGTGLGLYHFDRATERFTRVYRHDADNPNTLSSDMVNRIHEDRQGYLWLITITAVGQFLSATHLDRLDPRSGTVRRYRHNPEAPTSLGPGMIPDNRVREGDMSRFPFVEDRQGRIWVGTLGGGLNRYDPESDGFIRYRHDPDDPASLSHDHVTAITEDRQGRIWVGTLGGLNLMDDKRGTFTRYRNSPADPMSLGSDHIFHLHADRLGMLWVATRGGLNRFDPDKSGTFTRYGTGRDDPKSPGDASAAVVQEEANGNLWLLAGTNRETHALTYYDRARDAFTVYREDANDPGSVILFQGILSTLVDRAGVLWFGTWGGGLNKVARSTQKFRAFRHEPADPNSLGYDDVRAILEDHEGRVWIGTMGGGLDRFDAQTETFTHYRHDLDDPSSLSSDKVWTVYEDRQQRLWVGTDGGGLNRFDRATGTFTHFRHDPDDPGSLSSDAVMYMLQDREGYLWIGTFGGGLNRFDPGANAAQNAKNTFTHYWHDPDDPTTLASDEAIHIYEDRAGDLWIVTNTGVLQRFDRTTQRFEPFDQIEHPLGVFEDRAGRFWVTSFTKGWLLFDRATGDKRAILPKSGALRKSFWSCQEDAHGHLWISTDNGLDRLDPETETVRTYDVLDGLPSHWFRWSNIPARSRDGKLYFGASRGFIVFDPDEVEAADNAHPPQVVLTSFRLGEDAISIGPDSPLKKHVSIADTLELRHTENNFTITYAALDYSHPEKNQYKYRLEPYDEAWREVGTLRQATYTNMAPGAYTFRVIGSNNDGVWNEEGASLRITILPPWWRSWWAYALYALLLVGAAVGAFRVQRGRLLRKAELEQTRLRAEVAESQARAMEAENERSRVEVEKARELETAYTRLKTTQQQLVQSEKLASLGQLTSGIAHELKNPLNFVNNFAEVNTELADELREELRASRGRSVDEVADGLEEIAMGLKTNAVQIAKHGKRADRIVQSMMDHARGGTGERYEVGLNAFVDEYVNLSYRGLQAQVPDLKAEIERDYGEAVGNVEMAPQELGRAVLNVLNNAFEAVHRRARSGEGAYVPRVKVSTRLLDGRMEIRVCDNGGGIPTEIKDRIFEPFFTTKPTGQGSTGLGLSLAYDIVTQGHGGTLAVESTEGEGATLMITLPR